jgi:hypothetical protein
MIVEGHRKVPLYTIKGYNMKVLVTGMASSHTKPSANTSFFGTLVKAVETFATVEWATPSVTWTKEFLDQYDSVVVGVVPPTSLGANKVYGAMHVINLLYNSPKLTLVVDNPQLWQFKASLASVARDVSSIFTPFYSKRREHKLASNPKISGGIQSAADKLLNLPWPKTIYPELPWKTVDEIGKFISTEGTQNLVGINLDAMLLADPKPAKAPAPVWVADSPTSSWTKKIEKLLSFPTIPLRGGPRDTDEQVFDRISSSFGLLMAPQERGVGTWWSYRYVQALNASVPVVSDWRDTGSLSNNWYVLGSTLEESTYEERLAIARAQREDYMKSIPSQDESMRLIKSLITNHK